MDRQVAEPDMTIPKSPASVVPRPTPPALPIEIIRNILNFLAERDTSDHIPPAERHALVQCMRVSSEMNDIAAPLLYRTVKLDNFHMDIWTGCDLSIEDAQKRKSKTKTEIPEHVEIVDVAHWDDMCYFDPHEWNGVALEIPTLRISLVDPILDEDGILDDDYWDGLEVETCACNVHFAPRQIILRGSSSRWPWPIVFAELPPMNSTVTIMTKICSSPHIDFNYSNGWEGPEIISPRQSTATFIFLTAGPSVAFSEYYGSADAEWQKFCFRLISGTEKVSYPNRVLVVGIESLMFYEMLPMHDGQTKNDDVDEWCRRQRDVWNEQLDGLFNVPDPRINYKTTEELKDVKIEFISMKTYLAKHDWKGTLKPEEVSGWLEAMEEEDNEEEMNSSGSVAEGENQE